MASMTKADQTAMMMALQKELAEMKKAHEAVSYTHLTLPTNREV